MTCDGVIGRDRAYELRGLVWGVVPPPTIAALAGNGVTVLETYDLSHRRLRRRFLPSRARA